MMNTIEYRVDCQLLQYLHEENNLGCRWVRGECEGDCQLLQHLHEENKLRWGGGRGRFSGGRPE